MYTIHILHYTHLKKYICELYVIRRRRVLKKITDTNITKNAKNRTDIPNNVCKFDLNTLNNTIDKPISASDVLIPAMRVRSFASL